MADSITLRDYTPTTCQRRAGASSRAQAARQSTGVAGEIPRDRPGEGVTRPSTIRKPLLTLAVASNHKILAPSNKPRPAGSR